MSQSFQESLHIISAGGREMGEQEIQTEPAAAIEDRIVELKENVAEAGADLTEATAEPVFNWLAEIARLEEGRGNTDQANRVLQRYLNIAQTIGSHRRMVIAYGQLGLLAHRQHDLAKSERMHLKAIHEAKLIDWHEAEAAEQVHLAMISRDARNFEKAEHQLLKALRINEALKRPKPIVANLIHLGAIARLGREITRAESYYRRAMEISQRANHREGIAAAHGGLGRVEQSGGNREAARGHWEKALALYRELGAGADAAKIEQWLNRL